jgi:hypothetical protein
MTILDLIMIASMISGIYFIIKDKPKYYYISLLIFLLALISKLMGVNF